MSGTPDLAPIRTVAELRAEADALKTLAAFPASVKRYTEGICRFREAARPYGKLIANEDRFRVVHFIFPLWAQRIAAGGDGSLTYGAMHEVCAIGQVSPRVLKTTLALAVHLGFFTREQNPSDRRSWLYVPTPTMAQFPHQWLVPATEALDRLLPGQNLTQRLKSEPELLIRFFLSAGREFFSGLEPPLLVPDFMRFCGHREGATLVAHAMLVAEMNGRPYPSRSEVAAQFALTKSQVAQVIAAGVELGFVTVDAGVAQPTDAMREGNADWTAVALAFLHHHLR